MTTQKKFTARILSMALSVAMVFTVMPTTALAAEGDVPIGASSINTVGTIKSFDKLEGRFSPSTGTNAPDHVYSLSVALNTPFEDVQLPTELTAMVEITTTKPAEDVKDSGKVEETTTTTAQKNVAVSWNSDKEYKSDVNGQLIYTAVLPEGYTLAEGVNLPQIYVMVGRQARTATATTTVTITTIFSTTVTSSGETLQKAITASRVSAHYIGALKITAGKVTTDDWSCLEKLKGLKTFEIDSAVTTVENIPEGTEAIFPKTITSVIVPQAITIGAYAFYECDKLTTASFTKATSINEFAFQRCTALTSIDFSAAENIGGYAFAACTSLASASASFPNAIIIGENAFYECKAFTNVSFPKATSIGKRAFESCTALTTASFPVATSIITGAFEGCTALTTASFPVATSIGEYAFRGCTALTTASFPVATSIGANAFFNCAALATLKLPAAPPSVGDDAFRDCPTTRALGYLAADGTALADTALTNAQAKYKDVNDGNTTNGKWYGWTIGAPADIAIIVNSAATPANGKTLEAAIAASNFDLAAIFSLKITSGEVTTADWKHLNRLIELETFEIGSAVVDVADIPTPDTILFPMSIVSVTVPQEIVIGEKAFSECAILTSASFPKATSIGNEAFDGCAALTSASFPKAASIGKYAFRNCAVLTSASFPVAESIDEAAFDGCTVLATLKLGATPPSVGNFVFSNQPATRALGYVTADGTALAGTALTNAQAAYKAANDGNKNDDLWYGWTIVSATPTPPTPPTPGGGGSSSGGGTTTPAGGTAGGTNTPGKTVIDNPVGSTGSANPLAEAVKNATAVGKTSATSYVNYTNYTALTVDGLKAINDAAAAAVKDKNVKLSTKLQLDNTVGNVVLSRVTVDPAKISAVMPDRLDLGIWFNQATDAEVIAVKDKFERAFSNNIITITFEQKTPLAVNMELALKPDLSELNTKNLYFYSYNPETNLYNRVWSPAYWVDKNGYSHITAPFGGSIIITDTPLTLK